MIRAFAAVVAALLLGGQALAAEDAPVVRAPAGPVQGVRQGDVQVFRGIPYAKPPVGPLRWRAPVAHPDWAEMRKASDFAPACIQPRLRNAGIYTNPVERMSEDCLALNIWVPATAATRKLPVFVWIHGGALVGGHSSEGIYDGARIAANGHVIVVSINYRLGVLGYFAHPALSAENPQGLSDNYGLLDQVAALRWVQRNIAAFGGDPANVTIAGESAGALSVMYLMASPVAHGLFHKAISQSAYLVSTPELKQARHGVPSAEGAGAQLMTALGATDIAALRAMDAEKLAAEAGAKGFVPWGTVDGVILPRQLVDVWDRGEQAKVPVLAGFNQGEIRSLTVLLAPPPASAAAYEASIRERYGDLAEYFLRLYPAANLREAMLAYVRDAMYGWTAQRLAIGQTAIGERSYLYLFDHGYPAADDNALHAFHAAEIPYVFGTAGRTPPYWPKIPDALDDRRQSDAMMAYWASFAHSASPRAPGQPDWQAYGKEGHYMAFAGEPRPATRLMPGMFALHEAAMCRRRAAGDQPWNWNVGTVSPVLAKAAGCR